LDYRGCRSCYSLRRYRNRLRRSGLLRRRGRLRSHLRSLSGGWWCYVDRGLFDLLVTATAEPDAEVESKPDTICHDYRLRQLQKSRADND
jgi:hypothetical protein